VVPGSLVQGGSYTPDLERRRPRDPVRSESGNGLSNLRGTVSAPQSGDAASASSQFVINLGNNAHLDPAPGSPGYTVFGRVTAGLEILDGISMLPTRRVAELTEVPLAPVELTSVTTLTRTAMFGLSVEADPARLRADFETARNRSDVAATLATIDALRRGCLDLDSRHFLAEAEAAIELDRIERARYSLEQYLAGANRNDPQFQRLQRLYTGLPQPGSSNVEARVSHCRQPLAPSIPNAYSTDLATLRAIEGSLRSYRQNGEFFLRCVAQVIDSGTLNDLETADATALYNDVVIELTAVTTRFNATARAFIEAND
jgi:cyclophilin family peptidyl-prolyl cis-trans isomerase